MQLVTDPEADERDTYGRLLRYVILPGDAGSLNAALVRLVGLARAYRQFPHSPRPAFLEYEAAAFGSPVHNRYTITTISIV